MTGNKPLDWLWRALAVLVVPIALWDVSVESRMVVAETKQDTVIELQSDVKKNTITLAVQTEQMKQMNQSLKTIEKLLMEDR